MSQEEKRVVTHEQRDPKKKKLLLTEIFQALEDIDELMAEIISYIDGSMNRWWDMYNGSDRKELFLVSKRWHQLITSKQVLRTVPFVSSVSFIDKPPSDYFKFPSWSNNITVMKLVIWNVNSSQFKDILGTFFQNLETLWLSAEPGKYTRFDTDKSFPVMKNLKKLKLERFHTLNETFKVELVEFEDIMDADPRIEDFSENFSIFDFEKFPSLRVLQLTVANSCPIYKNAKTSKLTVFKYSGYFRTGEDTKYMTRERIYPDTEKPLSIVILSILTLDVTCAYCLPRNGCDVFIEVGWMELSKDIGHTPNINTFYSTTQPELYSLDSKVANIDKIIIRSEYRDVFEEIVLSLKRIGEPVARVLEIENFQGDDDAFEMIFGDIEKFQKVTRLKTLHRAYTIHLFPEFRSNPKATTGTINASIESKITRDVWNFNSGKMEQMTEEEDTSPLQRLPIDTISNKLKEERMEKRREKPHMHGEHHMNASAKVDMKKLYKKSNTTKKKD